MALLLDRRGADTQITTGVMRAAARNKESGREMMALMDIDMLRFRVELMVVNQVDCAEVIAIQDWWRFE